MSQQVQDLIEKIQREGVEEAKQKAASVEQDAQQRANQIIADAKQQAAQLIQQAEADIAKKEESARMSLQQAARDTVIALKEKIKQTLQQVISAQTQATLSADELSAVLKDLIMQTVKKEDVLEVQLSDAHYQKLQEGFIDHLKKQIQNEIVIQPNSGLQNGFIISYDAGKSSFDFSEESLSLFLTGYVNDYLASILKDK